MRRLEIPVEGMHCDGCARTLQVVLERLDGVRVAKADFASSRVRVSFDPDRVDAEQLRAQIERAGYQPLVEELS